MKIRWTEPTGSGLADRLSDITMLVAYVRLRQAKLYLDWPPYQMKGIDVLHRGTDILLENVLKFIVFPPEVVFDKSSPCDEYFDGGIGGGAGLHQLYSERFSGHGFDFETYSATVYEAARSFGYCDRINEFLSTLPEKFVSFHIRRGDKVRNESTDGSFIHILELDWLNSATYRALDFCMKKGYEYFFLCGDEDEKTAPFISYLQAHGKSVIKIPEMPKWESTYYDLATMTKSDAIIVSQRYSSFSRFPSLVARCLFTSVFEMDREKLI